jgi:hypothetical protein
MSKKETTKEPDRLLGTGAGALCVMSIKIEPAGYRHELFLTFRKLPFLS